MRTLRAVVADAASRGVAVGHFNFSTLDGLHAIVRAAESLSLPVMVGVSEGERAAVGVRQAAALVQSFRESGLEVYLNADHTYSVEGVKAAIDAGFDEVIFDGAKLSPEENIATTKECVAYARASGRDVLVEAEIGYIGTSSALMTELPAGAAMTLEELPTPEACAAFVAATGVDLLAPAVGNIHGMLANGRNPALFIDRIAEDRAAAGVPLVLHGGSGTSDDDFRRAIANGMAVVHINTEMRVAWAKALKDGLAAHPDETTPYKIIAPATEAMEKVVADRLALFAGLTK